MAGRGRFVVTVFCLLCLFLYQLRQLRCITGPAGFACTRRPCSDILKHQWSRGPRICFVGWAHARLLNAPRHATAARRAGKTPEEQEDERLLATVARQPELTPWELRSHPKIGLGFGQVEDMFKWDKIAAELGIAPDEAMQRTFGPKLKFYEFLQQRPRMPKSPTTWGRCGVIVRRNIMSEDEEARALAFLRGDQTIWQPRELHGLRANFGPTLTSQYKVHRDYKLTRIPAELQHMREQVIDFVRSSEYVQSYGMTEACRQGKIGHNERDCFNQALIQRYRGAASPEAEFSQTLPMHFDQKDDWAEVVAGVNLGARGHIFFAATRDQACLTFEQMQKMARKRKGILVTLQRRSAYAFFGFARYGLLHGVAGCASLREDYDRISVTWRSVLEPAKARMEAPRHMPSEEATKAADVELWGQRTAD